MFDNAMRRAIAAPQSIPPAPIEFYTIALSPLADGGFFISLKTTSFDVSEYELLDREIAAEQVSSLDQALIVMAQGLRAVLAPSLQPAHDAMHGGDHA